jgi:hypothetical protein
LTNKKTKNKSKNNKNKIHCVFSNKFFFVVPFSIKQKPITIIFFSKFHIGYKFIFFYHKLETKHTLYVEKEERPRRTFHLLFFFEHMSQTNYKIHITHHVTMVFHKYLKYGWTQNRHQKSLVHKVQQLLSD